MSARGRLTTLGKANNRNTVRLKKTIVGHGVRLLMIRVHPTVKEIRQLARTCTDELKCFNYRKIQAECRAIKNKHNAKKIQGNVSATSETDEKEKKLIG